MFRYINRLFVLSLKFGTEEPTKNSFDDYYMPTIKVKEFNVLTDHKSFFDQPVKSKHMKLVDAN